MRTLFAAATWVSPRFHPWWTFDSAAVPVAQVSTPPKVHARGKFIPSQSARTARMEVMWNAIIINSCYSNYLVNFLCKNISFALQPAFLLFVARSIFSLAGAFTALKPPFGWVIVEDICDRILSSVVDICKWIGITGITFSTAAVTYISIHSTANDDSWLLLSLRLRFSSFSTRKW